jgi:ATP-dependent helicase/nuclease subunit A
MKKIKELDPAQKAAVTANINAVVSAGAGSGKTSVLAERFAYLVTEKHFKVDEILTLTFTKKATVEMYSRIYATLKDKNPSLVNEFYKAKIQTLDSYCASVVRTGAHLYGIQPDFTEDDEPVNDAVSAMALPFILKNRDNQALQLLIQTKQYAEIAQELFVTPILSYSSIANQIDFRKEMEAQRNEVVRAWQENSEKAASLYGNLVTNFTDCEANKATIFGSKMTDLLKEEFPEQPVITEDDIAQGNVSSVEPFIMLFNKIAFLSQAGVRGEAWQPTKDVLGEMRDLCGTLISLANYIYGYPVTEAIVPLLEEFQTMVNNLKRTTGTLTFKDVSELAVVILKEHPELRALEKQQYKAILIDEFQDNNSMQRDLLFMLAEKPERMEQGIPAVSELCADKLFFVGDEKQSIYRFRGADVSVFRSLKDSFPKGNIELETNYRSHPALIAAFNTLFGGETYPPSLQHVDGAPSLFYKEQATTDTAGSDMPEIPSYEAIYHTVLAPKKDDVAPTYEPRIHFAYYDKDAASDDDDTSADNDTSADKGPLLSADETEAAWVAKKIKSLIDGADGKKPVNPGDIAILFRTYAKQPTFERMLLQAGVPYNSEVVKGFFTDGPVNDLFAFLRLCVYPNDTLSYATLLRSPFVHLSVEETEAVIAKHTEKDNADRSQLFTEKEASVLSGASARRFTQAGAFFTDISIFSKTAPVANTVTRLWYEIGYRYETLWNRRVEMYNTLYDRIFELARLADENSEGMASFVDNMRTYEDQNEKLEGMDIPLEHSDSVHLLTIFKSKGLEYPIVFICGTDSRAHSDTNVEAVCFNKEFGVSINTPAYKPLTSKRSNYFFEKMQDSEARMSSAELRRIVYVAVTRAIDEVYITGKSQLNFDGASSYLPGADAQPITMLAVLEPALEYYTAEANLSRAPFTVEQIEPLSRSTAFESEAASHRRNDNTAKETFFKIAAPIYDKVTLISKDIVSNPYCSPSQLHAADDETTALHTSSAPSNVPYPEINQIIESTRPKMHLANKDAPLPEPRFAYTNFGTIAHAYLEAAIKNEQPVISTRDVVGLDGSEKKKNTIFALCQQMADTFKATDLGKRAASSPWHKAEYSFRSRVSNKIVKGTMDLVFKESNGTYTIVDYKTNQTMQPEIYYTQLACYREAIASMLGCDASTIQCYLYYLRFGKQVDITAECAKVNVTSEIQKVAG